MHPYQQYVAQSRRRFLATSASGLGGLALASMLKDDGLLAAEAGRTAGSPVAAGAVPFQAPHFAPKAKRCIFFFMEGAPSQLDLWDPKPKLNELHGQKL